MDAAAAASGETRGAVPRDRVASVIPLRSTTDPFPVERRRRQLQHDIRHQLGAIMMLASVIGTAPDVGPVSRARSQQIVEEGRWMGELIRAYDEAQQPATRPAEPTSVDQMAAEVVATLRLTHATALTVRLDETWAYVNQLALWRSLRNVVDNALRAAGDEGHVAVRVYAEDGWVVAQVDDDGPGFGAGPAGLASLGLGIVRDFVADHGGELDIGAGALGGAQVRILLPAEQTPTAPQDPTPLSWG